MIEIDVRWIWIAFLFGAWVGLAIAIMIDEAAARAKKKLLDDHAKWKRENNW